MTMDNTKLFYRKKALSVNRFLVNSLIINKPVLATKYLKSAKGLSCIASEFLFFLVDSVRDRFQVVALKEATFNFKKPDAFLNSVSKIKT